MNTPEGVRPEEVDLTDQAATLALMRRVHPDVVIHLASSVEGGQDRGLVIPMLRANLVTAVNVMLASTEVGCRRVVLAGSMEEPGAGDGAAPPKSPYAAAKWAARGYARLFFELYELPVAHLRVFMVYGPGQRDLRKLVPYVTCSLLRGEAPELTSGGRGIDWVYVDDVVDAFLTAAVAPGIDGTSLEVGTGRLVTARELVMRLHALVGSAVEPVFGALPDRALERDRVADPSLAAEAMGWKASTSLDDGLQRTVDFYRNHLELPAGA